MKLRSDLETKKGCGHPPRGGCWLKLTCLLVRAQAKKSPSARRVLVEIPSYAITKLPPTSHPPRGGCWLKSTQTGTSNMRNVRHPPRGGCWLKCLILPVPRRRMRHPPRGGCWLKYHVLEPGAHQAAGHPPRGGCWLKYLAWYGLLCGAPVTLREEGVG